MRTNSNGLHKKKLEEEVLKRHNLLITELFQHNLFLHFLYRFTGPKHYSAMLQSLSQSLILSITLLKPYRFKSQGEFDLFHS